LGQSDFGLACSARNRRQIGINWQPVNARISNTKEVKPAPALQKKIQNPALQ
jgi:hypothetical protein